MADTSMLSQLNLHVLDRAQYESAALDENALYLVKDEPVIYAQDEEPTDAPEGSIWVDMDTDSAGISSEEIIPHIGENENWYIGDVDTGNPSRGNPGVYYGSGEAPAWAQVQVDPDGEGMELPVPVRGVDYWTETDKSEIKAEIAARDLAPVYAASTEEMTDTERIYLGENGNLWTYGETEKPGEQIIINEQLYNSTSAKFNTRLNSSGIEKNEGTAYGLLLLDYIDLPIPMAESLMLKIEGVNLVLNTGYGYEYHMCYFDESKNYLGMRLSVDYPMTTGENGAQLIDVFDASYAANARYIRITLSLKASGAISASDASNLVVSLVTVGTIILSDWFDTGIKYANYSLTEVDADIIADKVLERLDVSYVSSDKVLTVGQYTFRYDGEAVADIGVST